MHLESMHKVIKYVYLEGKKIKRLDKTLHCLQLFLRDKTVERIIKLTKGKCSQQRNLISARHWIALIMPNKYSVLGNSDDVNTYVVNETEQQLIVKRTNKPCCELQCQFWNICVNNYECTWADYTVKSTICKHIHFLCINSKTSSHLKNMNQTDSKIMKLIVWQKIYLNKTTIIQQRKDKKYDTAIFIQPRSGELQ